MSPLMVSVSGVRGIVGPELNAVTVAQWAAAMAEILEPGAVVLGRDSRTSGEALADAASSALRSMGLDVRDIGVVPTPTVQIAVEHWGAGGGLILSASHNPAPWNALKFVDRDGSFLSPDRFERLRRVAAAGPTRFVDAGAYGSRVDMRADALRLHREAIVAAVDARAIRSAGLTVWIDTGHGAGGALLPALAEELGVRLLGQRFEPTGDLPPNPEPTETALRGLLPFVPETVAFAAMVDPDADRFAIALPGTEIIGEEWTLPLVAAHLLARRAGARVSSASSPAPGKAAPITSGADALVTNLSTSTRLEAAAARYGAQVFRTPVGEAHVVGEMKAQGAILGGEGNGGVIDPEVHFGRDAAVAFARLCEAEALHPGGLRALAASFPPRCLRKEKLPVASAGAAAALEEALAGFLGRPDDRRDGLRWSRPDGFVHLRASNTEPILRAVVEAAGEAEASRIMDEIRRRASGGQPA